MIKLEFGSVNLADIIVRGCTDEQLLELIIDMIDFRDYDGFTTEAIKRIEKLREERL